MRQYCREILIKFCRKNKFTYHADKTKSKEEFYRLLTRSKVGVSIGGGGYDTLRFWEILGNNCLLLTERIDIYQLDSARLDYKRIYQFNNLYDFKYQLERVASFLKRGYKQEDLNKEYQQILQNHSSVSRVLEILNIFNRLSTKKQ
jgi:hypothetical protein